MQMIDVRFVEFLAESPAAPKKPSKGLLRNSSTSSSISIIGEDATLLSCSEMRLLRYSSIYSGRQSGNHVLRWLWIPSCSQRYMPDRSQQSKALLPYSCHQHMYLNARGVLLVRVWAASCTKWSTTWLVCRPAGPVSQSIHSDATDDQCKQHEKHAKVNQGPTSCVSRFFATLTRCPVGSCPLALIHIAQPICAGPAFLWYSANSTWLAQAVVWILLLHLDKTTGGLWWRPASAGGLKHKCFKRASNALPTQKHTSYPGNCTNTQSAMAPGRSRAWSLC